MRTSPRYTVIFAPAVVAVLIVAAVLSTGCKLEAKPDNTTPVGSVQALLELRAQNSTDTAAYERHVESTALAEALAADSAARPDTDTPIPEWDEPEVIKETSSTAEVKVVWKRDAKRFPEWVESTTFLLRKVSGKWLVTDARDDAASKETTGVPK